MKEDLSLIKRYPIVEYLERKGIKPVRRTPAYSLYRSPLREETHPSFKVDTGKNLWIRLCRRQRWKHHRPLYAFGGLHAVGSHPSLRAERSRYGVPPSYRKCAVCFHAGKQSTGCTYRCGKETDRHIRHPDTTFAGVPHERTLH